MKKNTPSNAVISHKIGEGRWIVRDASRVSAATSKRFDQALAPVAARTKARFAELRERANP